MKQFLLVLTTFLLLKSVTAQIVTESYLPVPLAERTVPKHKKQLKLTLQIDSVRTGNIVRKMNTQHTYDINYESDYIQINDSLHIKIFIARNQEYGKKFYSWKWDYLKKTGSNYNSLGSSFYYALDYNQPISEYSSHGQGLNAEGDPDYLMIYYRYKLE